MLESFAHSTLAETHEDTTTSSMPTGTAPHARLSGTRVRLSVLVDTPAARRLERASSRAVSSRATRGPIGTLQRVVRRRETSANNPRDPPSGTPRDIVSITLKKPTELSTDARFRVGAGRSQRFVEEEAQLLRVEGGGQVPHVEAALLARGRVRPAYQRGQYLFLVSF